MRSLRYFPIQKYSWRIPFIKGRRGRGACWPVSGGEGPAEETGGTRAEEVADSPPTPPLPGQPSDHSPLAPPCPSCLRASRPSACPSPPAAALRLPRRRLQRGIPPRLDKAARHHSMARGRGPLPIPSCRRARPGLGRPGPRGRRPFHSPREPRRGRRPPDAQHPARA